MQATSDLTIAQVVDRYPRLTGHMICESLGYFTPQSAANAIRHHIWGEPFYCEWYDHMAHGSDDRKDLVSLGRWVAEKAYHNRHHHRGYMAHYPQAKAIVAHVRGGGDGPTFASWF